MSVDTHYVYVISNTVGNILGGSNRMTLRYKEESIL